MFSFLRSKMKVVFIIVAVAFLITIFAFWGMDMDSSQFERNVAFSVNGQDVSIKTYEDAVSRYLQQASGQEISEETRRSIRKQAADDLIGQKLLEDYANKMGLEITKEELKGHGRMEFPSEEVYQQYLRQAPAAWWQGFEEATSRRIKVSRARQPMLDAVWVSDSEWTKIVGDLYWEADVSQILIRPEKDVPDGDVKRYYESHRHMILDPTQVRARQILLKIDKDATDTQVKDVTERGKKVFELAKAGKDFAALARKFSEAPDADDGGDMGYFKPGDMLKEVDDVVFNLQPGQISDPVRTEFGLHIFKSEDRIPAKIKPLTPELVDELRPNAINDTHWAMAKKRAEKILEEVKAAPLDFEAKARVYSDAPSAKNGGRLGWMPRVLFPTGYENEALLNEVTSGSAIERDIGRAAFQTPARTVAPELVRTQFGWHILKVHAQRPISGTPPTDTDKAIVRYTYQRLLSEENLVNWVNQQRKIADIDFKIDIQN